MRMSITQVTLSGVAITVCNTTYLTIEADTTLQNVQRASIRHMMRVTFRRMIEIV